jgi:hypothetical protein
MAICAPNDPLVNLWVELRLRFTQSKRSYGPRRLHTRRLRLRRIRNFIRRAIERRYGTIAFIVAQVAPIGV